MLSILLLVDDLFMIHDFMIPRYTPATEEYLYAVYFFLMIAWGYYFYEEIRQSEYRLLGMALLFLGASVIGDLIISGKGIGYLVEDALKFLGITTWFIYLARAGFYKFHSTSLST